MATMAWLSDIKSEWGKSPRSGINTTKKTTLVKPDVLEPKPGFEPGSPELQAQVHTVCAFRRVQAGVNPARVLRFHLETRTGGHFLLILQMLLYLQRIDAEAQQNEDRDHDDDTDQCGCQHSDQLDDKTFFWCFIVWRGREFFIVENIFRLHGFEF